MGKRGWAVVVVIVFALGAFAVGWIVTSQADGTDDSSAEQEVPENCRLIEMTSNEGETVEVVQCYAATIAAAPCDPEDVEMPEGFVEGTDDLNGDDSADVRLFWSCGPQVEVLQTGSYQLRSEAGDEPPVSDESGGGIEPVAVAAMSAGAMVIGALGTPVVTAWANRRWGKDDAKKSDDTDE